MGRPARQEEREEWGRAGWSTTVCTLVNWSTAHPVFRVAVKCRFRGKNGGKSLDQRSQGPVKWGKRLDLLVKNMTEQKSLVIFLTKGQVSLDLSCRPTVKFLAAVFALCCGDPSVTEVSSQLRGTHATTQSVQDIESLIHVSSFYHLVHMLFLNAFFARRSTTHERAERQRVRGSSRTVRHGVWGRGGADGGVKRRS